MMIFDPSIPEKYHALYDNVIDSVRSTSAARTDTVAAFYVKSKENEDRKELYDSYFFYHWVRAVPTDEKTQTAFDELRINNGCRAKDKKSGKWVVGSKWRQIPSKGLSQAVFIQEIFEGSARLAKRTVFEHLVGYIKYTT